MGDEAVPAPSRKRKRGPYSYSKCRNCRKDKKKCEPTERPVDQPCHRCQEKHLQCSPHEDIRKKDTSPAPSLSGNSAITPGLEDPCIQCLHLGNWYRMMPDALPVKTQFRRTLLDVISNSLRNAPSSDLKGRALLAHVARNIDNTHRSWNDESAVEDVMVKPIIPSECPSPRTLELSRALWDAGDTCNAINSLWESMKPSSHRASDGPDQLALSHLRVLRQYFCVLKRFWAINRQLWEIHHSKLSTEVPELQGHIETGRRFDCPAILTLTLDQILDEEPEYFMNQDDCGNTFLHHITRSWRLTFSRDHQRRLFQSIQKLSDKGLNVNTKNKTGQTALHELCKEGYYLSHHVDILQLFFERKELEINAKNNDGQTALHLLCENYKPDRHVDFIAMLRLFFGHKDIDVGIKDAGGHIAAHCLPEAAGHLLRNDPSFLRLSPPGFFDDPGLITMPIVLGDTEKRPLWAAAGGIRASYTGRFP